MPDRGVADTGSRGSGWWMQMIERIELDVEGYIREQWHLKVRPRECCVGCGKAAKQHRHGVYWRDVVSKAGQLMRIAVARFLCTGCGVTSSYLPKFALTHRLLGASSLEAFLSGETGRLDVQRHGELLGRYVRQMKAFAADLIGRVGMGLGPAPPAPGQRSAPALAGWLTMACGDLELAAGRLVEGYRVGILGRYRCHLGRRG